jgi:hypothetical protein
MDQRKLNLSKVSIRGIIGPFRSLFDSFDQRGQPLTTAGDVVLLDRSSLAIEQYTTSRLKISVYRSFVRAGWQRSR